MRAHGDIVQARSEVTGMREALRSGDLITARSLAREAATRSRRARQRTSDPVWRGLAAVPVLGSPLREARAVTRSADEVSTGALPLLLDAGEQLRSSALRKPSGQFDLGRLTAAAPLLTRASTVVRSAGAQLDHAPRSTWLGWADSARSRAAQDLAALSGYVDGAETLATVGPVMLGARGPQHQLVVFQNDAEARGTGGLPGAFAMLETDHGTLSFTRFVNATDLIGTHAAVDFGPDYPRLYGGAATGALVSNANLSPHFPYAAQIWAQMWQRKYGERVDGVVAIDPWTLSNLLSATGPLRLTDGTELTQTNVIFLTQAEVYARFATSSGEDTKGRHDYLLGIASAVSKHLLAFHGDSNALGTALRASMLERRVLVWSADPVLEARLLPSAVGGAVPRTRAPYAGLSVVNEGGNKLDFYLDRALVWKRSGCGPTRHVTVTVSLTNSAPATGLSDIVVSRTDRHGYPVARGDNRVSLYYFATEGAVMRSVTLDGKTTTARIGKEQGHPVYVVDVELPRSRTRVVSLSLDEPSAPGPVAVLRQPLVRPLAVTTEDEKC